MPDTPSPRDAAFQAWLAEERRIQAQQARQYHDPLAGEEIMDATARLLAPRALRKEAPPKAAPHEAKRPAQSFDRRSNDVPRTPFSQTTLKTPKNGAKTPENRVKPTPKPAPPKKGNKQPQPVVPQSFHVEHPQPLPPQKAPSPKQEKPSPRRDSRRSDRPRRAPLEPLRPNAQKDSTEQRSLMKPYYFNSNED